MSSSSWLKLALKLSHFGIISKAIQLYLAEIRNRVQQTLSDFFQAKLDKSYKLCLMKHTIGEQKKIHFGATNFSKKIYQNHKNHIFINYCSIHEKAIFCGFDTICWKNLLSIVKHRNHIFLFTDYVFYQIQLITFTRFCLKKQ